jgi:hypothetical protein
MSFQNGGIVPQLEPVLMVGRWVEDGAVAVASDGNPTSVHRRA